MRMRRRSDPRYPSVLDGQSLSRAVRTLRVRLRTLRYARGASLVAAHPSVAPHLDARAGAQRARLLEGMTQAVAEKGYADATVADAVRAARVSRGTFYALFASKEACFLEAYRHGVEVLEAPDRRRGAHAAAGDWRAKLRAGLRAYLACLADEPAFMRTWMIEIHAAGPAAQAARDATLRRFADRYRASFARSARAPALPSGDALFVLAAGVDQLVCARLRAGGLARPRGLTDTLLTCAVALLAGAAATEGGAPDGPDLLRARDRVPRRAARLVRGQRPGPRAGARRRTRTTPGGATSSAASTTAAGPRRTGRSSTAAAARR